MLNPEDNILAEWFADNRYTEVDCRSFYRDIFPEGLFDVRDAKTPGVGRGLVQTIQKPTKKDDSFHIVGKTIPVYDDLTELYQTIDDSVKIYEQYQRKGVADRVQILTCTNGCSYMGHECLAENVYMMSAMIIEIDDIIYDENGMAGPYCYNPIGLKNMLNQMRPVEMPRSGRIRPAVYPTPTYIVCSGSGMHLYYVFQEPLRINKKYFHKHYEAVDLYKKCLMGALWRSKTITEKPVEIQGIAQRYRCVGSPTKTGSVVRAFQIGDKVSLEYMNSFRDNLKYEDENHRFQECPELSEIVNTAPGTARPYKKKTYPLTGNLGKGAYTQALERIKTSAMEGKRYWFLYCLAATARMCAIPEKQLKVDAYNLLDFMNSLTVTPDNEFTMYDIECALKNYSYRGPFMRRTTYERLCGIQCPPPRCTKKNGRKLPEHLTYIRKIKAMKKQMGEEINEGRPLKWWSTFAYRVLYPNNSKADALRDGVAAKGTIRKYWSLVDELEEKDLIALENLYASMQDFDWDRVKEGNIPMKTGVRDSVKAFAEKTLEYHHILEGYKKNGAN